MMKSRILRIIKLFFFFLFSSERGLQYSIEEGIRYSYSSQNGAISTHISYEITGEPVIEIERVTIKDGGERQVDYIVLRFITEEDAGEMHQLVINSEKFLKRYMDMYMTHYGGSEEQTRRMIYLENSDQNRMSLGIFYKKNKGDKERMVGCVGYHSPQAFRAKENSVDIFYWVGDPRYIGVRGLVTVVTRALVDWLVAVGRAGKFVITADKKNDRSIRIAVKLKMRKMKYHQNRKKSEFHEKWPYGDGEKGPENMDVYAISAEEWQKYHWPKGKQK